MKLKNTINGKMSFTVWIFVEIKDNDKTKMYQ